MVRIEAKRTVAFLFVFFCFATSWTWSREQRPQEDSQGQPKINDVASLLLVVQNPVGVCRVPVSQCTSQARNLLGDYQPWTIDHLWSSAGSSGVDSNCKVGADCVPAIVVKEVLDEISEQSGILWDEYWPEIISNARHSEWHSQAHCARFIEGFGADCEEAAEDYFYQMAKLYKSVKDQLPTFLVKLGITSSNAFIPMDTIKRNIEDLMKTNENKTVHLGCHKNAVEPGKCTLTRIGICYRCSACETGTNACACSDDVQPPPCCARDHLPGEQFDCFQVENNFPSTVPWDSVDEDDVSCYTCDRVCYCGHGSPDCVC